MKTLSVIATLAVCLPVFGATPPVPIDATRYSWRQVALGNPFAFVKGTSLYMVLNDGDDTGLTSGWLGVFKCTLSGASCTRMNTAGQPSDALASYVAYSSPTSSVIDIAYSSQRTPSNQVKIVTYDTSSDTYGSPTAALILGLGGGTWPFTLGYGEILQKNNGTYYLWMIDIVSAADRLGYYTYSSGTWSSFTPVVTDTSNYIYSVTRNETTEEVYIYYYDTTQHYTSFIKIAADDTPGTPHVFTDSTAKNADRFDTKIVGTNLATVYADFNESTDYPQVSYLITPLASETFTNTLIWTIPDCDTFSTYGTIGVDGSGNVSAFWVTNNLPEGSPTAIKILQSTLSGVTWSSATTFYDEVANPPSGASLNGTNPQTAQALWSGSSWLLPTAMETTESGPGTIVVGYLLGGGSSPVRHRSSSN
jgi:hypothetical protein